MFSSIILFKYKNLDLLFFPNLATITSAKPTQNASLATLYFDETAGRNLPRQVHLKPINKQPNWTEIFQVHQKVWSTIASLHLIIYTGTVRAER